VGVPVAHNSAIQLAPDIFSRLLGTREHYFDLFEKAARAAEAAFVILSRTSTR
jgi:hypothetical protein